MTDFNEKIIRKYIVMVTAILAVVIIGINTVSTVIAVWNGISTHINYSSNEINGVADEINSKIISNKKLGSRIFLESEISDALNMREKDMEKISERLSFYKASDYYLESVYVYNSIENTIYKDGSTKVYGVDEIKGDGEVKSVIDYCLDNGRDFIRRSKDKYLVYTFVVQPYRDSGNVVVLNYYEKYINLSDLPIDGCYTVLSGDGEEIIASSENVDEKQIEEIKASLAGINGNDTMYMGDKVVVYKVEEDMIFLSVTDISSFIKRAGGVIIPAILCSLFMLMLVIFSFSGAVRWVIARLKKLYIYTEFVKDEMELLEKEKGNNGLKSYIIDDGSVSAEAVVSRVDKQKPCCMFEIYISEFERSKTGVSTKERNAFSYAVMNVFEELCQDVVCDIVRISAEEIVIITDAENEGVVYDTILRTRHIIGDAIDICFAVVRDSRAVRFCDIPSVYYELVRFRMRLFYFGTDANIDVADFEEENSEKLPDAMAIAEKLSASLNQGSGVKAYEIINQYRFDLYEPTAVKEFIINVLSKLQERYRELSEQRRKRLVLLISEEEKIIRDAVHIDEINKSLNLLFNNILDVIKYNQEEQADNVVDVIFGLIHENYHDPNLCREFISEKTKLSVKSLEQIFKSRQNQSMTNYIFTYRMERAKEMLDKTNLAVKDIAERVGYLNVSHFIQNFKKNYGVTPDKYRKTLK